jgi:hypothetical protein
MNENATETEMRPADADAGEAEQLARAALRSAIDRRDVAADELAQAERAAEVAFRRSVDLGTQIAEAEERKRWPSGARDDGGDVLVEALLDGRDLPSPETPSDEALGSLRAEHVAIRQARERLAPVIKDRRSRLEVAEVEVEAAAKATIASSNAVASIIADLPALLGETIKKRSALSFVAGCLSNGSAAAKAVSDLVYDAKPVSILIAEHPERLRWKAALSRLTRDASAKLPGDEEAD